MDASDASTELPNARRSRFRLVLLAVGLVLLLGIAALVVAGLLLRGTYPTVQTVERSFVIDEDFTKVRKILVRTDATKRIVTMTGDSQFVDQHWNAVGGGLDNLEFRDLKWKLELHGTLILRTRDPYIGEHEIELSQEVKVDPDEVYSDVELDRPTERLRQYEMTTWFTRKADGRTLVRQRLKQEIVTDAPWFAHFIADRRVYQSANRALENQEGAILKIIAENRDKRWLLLGDIRRPTVQAGLPFFNLDADAACLEQFVHAGEPQLVLPVQVKFGAGATQLGAVVSAATPETARPSPREIVFSGQ